VAVVVGLGSSALADLNDGLVAYYPFNGNADDESGNGNDGVVHGGTFIPHPFGNSDSAYSFEDGDYVQIPDSASLDVTPNITLAMWVRLPEIEGGVVMLWKHDATVAHLNPSYGLNTGPGGSATELAFNFGHNSQEVTTGYGLQAGVWTHIAVTFDDAKDELIFYKDGQSHQTTSTTRTIGINDAPLYLHGYRYNDGVVYSQHSVDLDEVRIYDRALTADEVPELVPVPGAAILGMIGIGMVGACTRKRRLADASQ